MGTEMSLWPEERMAGCCMYARMRDMRLTPWYMAAHEVSMSQSFILHERG